MAAMAWPTSPSSEAFLPAAQLELHGDRSMLLAAANAWGSPRQVGGPKTNAILEVKPSGGGELRLPAPPRVSFAAAASDTPRRGGGPKINAVFDVKPRGGELRLPAPQMSLMAAADAPRQGDGPKTNAVVLEVKARGGAGAFRRPTPPGGAGPKEGSGGSGGVIHAVADYSPQRPGAPEEGAGGNGGAVHAAPAAAASC
ncbi:hypothetical protein E2562_000398 [Oryza meyeriana var. granulata]|uniref:Uncharacterized protein n=1 Tax=Oryza meyeriana var. granulata TaxID=110450 RepID=A0A6G1CC17_9ORYZ|nr:hypothetical protein E2562_000398 [Oryza meyeriana var. granulata]